jgi:hypothetical protein
MLVYDRKVGHRPALWRCAGPQASGKDLERPLHHKGLAMKRLGSLETLGLWARAYRWADLRRFPRNEAGDIFAGLTIRNRDHIVRLHNWSAGGACVDLPGSAKLGERVHLVCGKLRRHGRIAWVAAHRAGIEFD